MQNIIFFLDSAAKKDGTKSIFAKQSNLKKRIPIAVNPKYWIKAKQQLSKNHPLWFEINTKLQEFVQFTHKKQLENNKYSIVDAINEFFAIKNDVDQSLLLPNALKLAMNIKKNIVTQSRLEGFEYLISDIAKTSLSTTKITEMSAVKVNILINFYVQKGNTNNTIDGSLRRLKALINTYSNNIQKLDLSYFNNIAKPKSYESDLIALTDEDLDKLMALKLSGGKEILRDSFIFACYTGARYIDIVGLDFNRDISNNEWLLRVVKTKDVIRIPLLPQAQELVEKHREAGKFEVMTNQKSNLYLKELCKKAGFNEQVSTTRYSGPNREDATKLKWELVSFHVARRTFITLSLTKGIPAEIVMKISGHKNYASFKKYIKFTTNQITKEFLDKWE